MINFKSIPFLKLLLPFVCGIIFTVYYKYTILHTWLLLSFTLLVIAYLFQKFHKSKHYFKKVFYIVTTTIFLFILANACCYFYQAKNNHLHYSHFLESKKQPVFATVIDIPVKSDKGIKLSLSIKGIKQNNTWHYTEGNVIAYLKEQSLDLKIGDVVYMNESFSYLNAPKNPNEFDYKTFLERKNIFHVIYTKTLCLTSSSFLKNTFSFSEIGTSIKSNLVFILRNSGLSQDAFAICSALLVGYDDEIASDVVQQFSHSGTLHILSVSGMHTGMLYLVLIWLFGLVDKNNLYKKTKTVVVLLSLWFFVAITGFSPAVLRAALMLSFILIGKTFYVESNTYNNLFVSAFILLILNPYLLLDVGFQLSYLAVLGILYLHPILSRTLQFDNCILQYFWNIALMSVAATLFTLPVALYNFHQFPIWFVFSNLIIIPLSAGIMIGAVVLIVFYKISFIKLVFVYLINLLTNVMLGIAQLTDNSNYGFIDWIHFSKLDIVFCSLSIFLTLLIIYSKQYKYVVCFFSCLILWSICDLILQLNQAKTEELVVFHVKQKSVVVLKTPNSVFMIGDSITDNEVNRYVKPYVLAHSNHKLQNIHTNFISQKSKSIAFCSNNYVRQLAIIADIIIVSNNTSIPIQCLQKKKPTIIADCSNNYTFVKEMKKRCAKAGAAFYSIKESGAFKIKL